MTEAPGRLRDVLCLDFGAGEGACLSDTRFGTAGVSDSTLLGISGAVRARIVFVITIVTLAVCTSASATPAKVGYPNSIAATGDSITRAFNTGTIPFTDAPGNSWSTGTRSTVASHYTRILSANPLIYGRRYNNARSGARMVDLAGQVTTVVSEKVEYVTILMGANDVCRSSEAAITSVSDFRTQFRSAIATVTRGLPDARVYVTSIPDVHRLWSVLKDSYWARLAWRTFGICQSMLANPRSTAQADVDRRARVRQREIDFNTQLAQVCAQYVHCRFDGNAVFNTAFTGSDVSTRDYFHPSIAGQTKLASVSWSAGFDFTDVIAPLTAATSTPIATGTLVSLSATDNVAVAGIEYRVGSGTYRRYTAPVAVASGTMLTYRAVDVNGNIEASHSFVG